MQVSAGCLAPTEEYKAYSAMLEATVWQWWLILGFLLFGLVWGWELFRKRREVVGVVFGGVVMSLLTLLEVYRPAKLMEFTGDALLNPYDGYSGYLLISFFMFLHPFRLFGVVVLYLVGQWLITGKVGLREKVNRRLVGVILVLFVVAMLTRYGLVKAYLRWIPYSGNSVTHTC